MRVCVSARVCACTCVAGSRSSLGAGVQCLCGRGVGGPLSNPNGKQGACAYCWARGQAIAPEQMRQCAWLPPPPAQGSVGSGWVRARRWNPKPEPRTIVSLSQCLPANPRTSSVLLGSSQSPRFGPRRGRAQDDEGLVGGGGRRRRAPSFRAFFSFPSLSHLVLPFYESPGQTGNWTAGRRGGSLLDTSFCRQGPRRSWP